MKRKRSCKVWKIIMPAICLSMAMLAACGKKAEQPETVSQESAGTEENTVADNSNVNAAGLPETQQPETQTAEDRLDGGSSGTLTYEVKYEQRQYEADNGTAIFELKLAYPVFQGKTRGEEAINAFFENWKTQKLKQYEEDEDSTKQSALEVYRESKDVGWSGPWGEEYEVSSVKVFGGYVSVLLDSYLYEGGAHGMPIREGHVFRLSDGQEVTLAQMTGKQDEELNSLLRARFTELVEEGEADMYYEDALEIIREKDMSDTGYYFGESGIVFYLPPYEIAPYAAGYVEITIPFEEIGIKPYEAAPASTESAEEKTEES